MLQNSCELRIIILHELATSKLKRRQSFGIAFYTLLASHLSHYVRMWNREVGNLVTHAITKFLFLHILLTHHPTYGFISKKYFFTFIYIYICLYLSLYLSIYLSIYLSFSLYLLIMALICRGNTCILVFKSLPDIGG